MRPSPSSLHDPSKLERQTIAIVDAYSLFKLKQAFFIPLILVYTHCFIYSRTTLRPFNKYPSTVRLDRCNSTEISEAVFRQNEIWNKQSES